MQDNDTTELLYSPREAYMFYLEGWSEGYGDGLCDEENGKHLTEPPTFDEWQADQRLNRLTVTMLH
ncbi:hypothetical protein LCGC14_0437070 [marine sediment metagenome]|uniref:Uncharacterized protein n=1 Tax=marine sediment metagenome TaxID=412755 RepID=A0A0F9VVY5_9ZZZZ